jgi:hypothetical protein
MENTPCWRAEKDFLKTACGWHGMGYVSRALENGRSVFPVERRFDGPVTEIKLCATPARFYFPRANPKNIQHSTPNTQGMCE